MIRFVFFDVGGVLGTAGPEIKTQFVREIGISLDDYYAFQERFINRVDTGKMTRDVFFQMLNEAFHLGRGDLETVWGTIFERTYREFPQTREWAMKLKTKYGVGILSNVSPLTLVLHQEKKAYTGFEPWVFLSCEMGFGKPDPRVFNYINQKTKTKSNECVLIDDREEHVIGARNSGWRAIHHITLEQTQKEFEKIVHEK
ncbi:MAG: HAD-IA family hydrolase [archaeon]